MNPLAAFPVNRALELTSSFGWRTHPITSERTHHNGVDLRGNEADQYLAAFDGVVDKVNFTEGGGNQVFLAGDHGWRISCSHLSRVDVRAGQRVRAGKVLGKPGRTGNVTGPHLHLELRNPAGDLVDPWPFLEDLVRNPPRARTSGLLKAAALVAIASQVL
jgi:murein DD-endopeptidase MepM/ murein hydrolase activator NlpD